MVGVRFSGFSEVFEGLGGDGAWVVAVGQDATGSMTPAPKVHEAGGKDFTSENDYGHWLPLQRFSSITD
jgi:hypothetical protein